MIFFFQLAGGVFADNCLYMRGEEGDDEQSHEYGEEYSAYPGGENDDEDEDFVDIENPWADGKADSGPAQSAPQKQKKGGATGKQHKRKK